MLLLFASDKVRVSHQGPYDVEAQASWSWPGYMYVPDFMLGNFACFLLSAVIFQNKLSKNNL